MVLSFATMPWLISFDRRLGIAVLGT